MKILAVDDDPLILELLCDFFAGFGDHAVLCAANGAEALTLAATCPEIDCFLLDIKMPGMDGIALARALRAMKQFVRSPIVMLTAMADKPHIDRAFAAGATDYISKPFEIAELSARMKLIDALVSERHAMAAVAPVMRSHAPTPPSTKAPLHLPFEIADVEGVIDPLSLENYIRKLSRDALYGSTVFAVSIRRIDSHYKSLSNFDFRSMVIDVAEALSDCLIDRPALLSYLGTGTFGCVTEGGAMPELHRLIDKVQFVLQEMDLHASDGSPLDVRLSMGKAERLTWHHGQGAVDALSRALASAEAESLRAERALDAVWFMEQSA